MTSKLLFMWFLCFGTALFAQNSRFDGLYPLTTPNPGSARELKAEYEQTVTAMAGAVSMLERETTLKNREDPEMLIKQDYLNDLDAMALYANELLGLLKSESGLADHPNLLKKAVKAAKSGKYEDADDALGDCGARNENSETVFFIWRDYLQDKKNNAPWLRPENVNASKAYRVLVEYVAKNFDRPYGVQAEIGAVMADAAQALSNCIESPESVAWKGETIKLTLKADDPLRRLLSSMVYYEWRLHDPTNGQRSAHINRDHVRHIQTALFELVASIQREKESPAWAGNPALGQNLQILVNDARTFGWSVDGVRAKKKGEAASSATPNPDQHTKTSGW